MQLLTSLNYFLPTSTEATWIEVFYTRTDVLTGGNATPLLRYAADVAKDLSRSLVHQTSMSQETPASAVAFGAPNVIRQRRQFLLFFLLSHFTVHVVTISIDSLSGVRDVTPFGAFLPRPKDTIWVEASLTLGLFMFSAWSCGLDGREPMPWRARDCPGGSCALFHGSWQFVPLLCARLLRSFLLVLPRIMLCVPLFCESSGRFDLTLRGLPAEGSVFAIQAHKWS